MRFFAIALFVFCFCLALNVANVLMPCYYMDSPTIDVPSDVQSYVPSTDISFAGMVIYGISLFFRVFLQATVLLPVLFNAFGVPAFLSWAISTIVWIIYIAGLIEFLTSKNITGDV